MKKISVLVLLLVGTIALAADYTKDNVEAIKAKVQKGEVVVVCGPSGSGKSTLIPTLKTSSLMTQWAGLSPG